MKVSYIFFAPKGNAKLSPKNVSIAAFYLVKLVSMLAAGCLAT